MTFIRSITGGLVQVGKGALNEAVDNLVPGAPLLKKGLRLGASALEAKKDIEKIAEEMKGENTMQGEKNIIVRVRRFVHLPTATVGLMEVTSGTPGDNPLFCFTIEDQFQAEKVAGETRIPAGIYPLELRTEGGYHAQYSEKYAGMHKGMVHIMNVPGFEYILIHVGNTPEDTEGCILTGDNYSFANEQFIGRSGDAYVRVYPYIAHHIETVPPGTAFIEVTNGFENGPLSEKLIEEIAQIDPVTQMASQGLAPDALAGGMLHLARNVQMLMQRAGMA